MRRLGQHFLKNNAVIERIAAALEIKSGETIVEIGPGHGELTGELLAYSFELLGKMGGEAAIKIVAVEKDARLAEELRKKFAADKNIEVVGGDVLKLLPSLPESCQLKANIWKLVGNIPYYITGHLLRTISELENKPAVSVLTIQKEVAERIVAAPPRMNRLAASVQFWATPKILGDISKRDFRPEPGVDSAIIKLEARSMKHEAGEENYYRAVRMLFAQPRKTILNNLTTPHFRPSEGGDPRTATWNKEKVSELLLKIGILPENRPQNLTVEEIEKIAQFFFSNRTKNLTAKS